MSRAAITIDRPREVVERRWAESEHASEYGDSVIFMDAPGDHGTEIHVDLDEGSGRLGELVRKVAGGADARAKAMDDLRRFKQIVETGVIARSEGTPEGELAERKFKQRPAQPLEDHELEKAGL